MSKEVEILLAKNWLESRNAGGYGSSEDGLEEDSEKEEDDGLEELEKVDDGLEEEEEAF